MGDVYPLTLLERLPTELLDMAASNVGTFDLLTHVNFCRVSQPLQEELLAATKARS